MIRANNSGPTRPDYSKIYRPLVYAYSMTIKVSETAVLKNTNDWAIFNSGNQAMRYFFNVFTAALLLSQFPISANAHHSMAIYDTQQELTVQGTVTRIHWRNPHVYIYIDEVLESGQVVTWEVEGLPPAGFRRAGWEQDTLSTGDEISVIGNPTRNISRRGIYPRSISSAGYLLFDESEFFQLALAASDAQGLKAVSIDGIWATVLNIDLLMSLGEGADFQNLTDAGELAVAEFEEDTMNPGANCEQVVPPLSMYIPTMNRIAIHDDRVTITGDYDGGVRTIYLDDNHVASADYYPQGYSKGRWDGTTLVVNTTRFAEHRMGNGWGLPSSSEKEMTERFVLNADGQSLSYEFTMVDPVYMTMPFSGQAEWKAASNLEFELDPCDLESARRFLSN